MKFNPVIHGIEITMCNCAAVTNGHELIKVLKSLGCEFMHGFGPEVNLHPERRVKHTGSIIAPVRCQHAVLGRDLLTRSKLPIAAVTYLSESRTVGIHQAADASGRGWDELSRGQLKFARLLYDELKPSYAWIDASAETPLPELINSIDDIAFLFWMNMFGPKISDSFGKSFLSHCPEASVDCLGDGGTILGVEQSFSDWVEMPQAEVLAHLRQRVSRLKLFRS